MSKYSLFRDLKVNAAFTPAPGEIGTGQVFVKKPNGICPLISKDNPRTDFDRWEQEGIFWPLDRVSECKVPPKILNRYQ